MATKKMTGKPAVKKYDDGGQTRFEKRQARKIAKAKTKAEIAAIEGEGTVSQKRDNRANRVSTMAGTGRSKLRRLSTSNSTSTSNVDNRNSGNTSNTTNSGSSANSGS